MSFGVALALLAASTAPLIAQAPESNPTPGPTVLCYKTDEPKEINGRLDDWEVRQWDSQRLVELRSNRQIIVGKDRWGGESDLSATLYTAYDDYNFYVAGSIKDDQLVHIPEAQWWIGDAIEIFLDVDSRNDRELLEDAPYADDDHQIFLMPMNPTIPWGVYRRGASVVMGHAGFEGVRFAYSRVADGYEFEFLLPFVNLLATLSPPLRPHAGLSIGFDVAIDDTDDPTKSEIESYMTWSGRSDLAFYPRRFGRLELRDDLPPAPATSQRGGEGERLLLWTLSLLAGLTALSLALDWLLRRWYPKSLAWKGTVAALLVAALALAYLVPTLLASNAEEAERARFEVRVGRAQRVLDEVALEQVLDLSDAAGQDRLLKLLRGERVPHRQAFSYEFIPLLDPASRKTLQDTLHTDYGNGFAFGEGTTAFPAREGLTSDRIHFIFQVPGPPPGGSARLPRDSKIGRFTVVFANGERFSTDLKLGVTADYAIGGTPLEHPQTMSNDVKIASRKLLRDFQQEHSDELTVTLSAAQRRLPIESIELTVDPVVEKIRLFGITTESGGGMTPYPLAHRTLAGFPVELVSEGPEGQVALLEPDKPFVREVNARADFLWLVYATTNAYPSSTASPRGEIVADIRVHLDGEKDNEQRAMLISGVEVDDAEREIPLGHPSTMSSRVALRFPQPSGKTFHADVFRLEVDRERTIKSIEVVQRTRNREQMRLYGLTAGTLVEPRFPHLEEVTVDHQGFVSLTETARQDLSGLAFAVHPRASAASRRPLSTVTPVRLERENGRDVLTASAIAPPEGPRIGRVGLSAPFEGRPLAFAIRTWACYLLLGFLVPLVVVIILDVLDLGPRLRWKFAAAFAIVCIVPLGFLFPLFNGLIESSVEARISDKALSRLKSVLDAFRDRRDRVQLATDAMLRDLQDLMKTEAADTKPDQIRERLTELRNARFADHKTTFVVLRDNLRKPDGSFASNEIRSEFSADDVASSGILALLNEVDENDVYSGWGNLALFGAHVQRPGGRRSQDLFVGEPVDASLLSILAKEESGIRGAEVFLYSAKGYPYLATLDNGEEKSSDSVSETAGIVQALEERGGTMERARRIRNEQYHVAYGLLQNQKGATVALIGVGVPLGEAAGFLDRVMRYFLVLGALIAGLSLFVGTLLTRKITGPIERLGALTREVRRGNLDVHAPVTARDEVGNLTSAFNDMTQELNQRLRDLHVLTTGIQSLSSELEPAKIVEVAARAFNELARPAGVAFVFQWRSGADAHCLGGEARGMKLPESPYPPKSRVIEKVLRTGEPLLEAPIGPEVLAAEECALLGIEPPGALLALPLKVSGETRGAVILLYPAGGASPESANRDVLLTLAQQVAVGLEHARLYRLAIEDPLTGTHVHSYFQGRLQEEVDRASRSGRPLSLLKVAVDAFPRARERYGAEVAGAALREIARRLQAGLRRMYVMARSGEDRFEILLPETEKEEARGIAEAISLEIASKPITASSRELRLTLSVGLANFPEDAKSYEFLTREADLALQVARERGRNRVIDVQAERARAKAVVGDGFPAVFRSPRMLEIVETVKRVAGSNVTVLIQGETGVGKEVLAEMIHHVSDRRDRPLVKVSCSAIPETLLEAELFGHERGAFTGATARKLGRFEVADKGTLFLDEIGDVPLPIQVKLLRVLQDRTFERLGGNESIKVDVRIVVATNRDLQRLIAHGQFREDLYYRINVISIQVPPLRERKEEIPLLVDLFMNEFNRRHGRAFTRITPAAMDLLFNHAWPGNVRELKNCLERAMVIAQGEVIRAIHIQFDPSVAPPGADYGDRGVAERLERIEGASGRGESPAFPSETPLAEWERSLNERQRQLLRYLREKGSITNPEYFEMVNVSQRTGLRDLTQLIEKRILVRHGKTRGCVYRLARS